MFAVLHSPQDFFLCLNQDNSDQAEWYKKIKTKIGRLIYQRRLHEATSKEAEVEHEVFHQHIKALCCALAKANTAEGARRKLAIKTLWVCCGTLHLCARRALAAAACYRPPFHRICPSRILRH